MVEHPRLQTAHENLLYIRKTLEAAGQLTAVSGKSLMAAGIIALAGAAVNALDYGSAMDFADRSASGSNGLGYRPGAIADGCPVRHVSQKPAAVHSDTAAASAQTALEPLPGSFRRRSIYRSCGSLRQPGLAACHMAWMLWSRRHQWRAGIDRTGPIHGIVFFDGCRRSGIVSERGRSGVACPGIWLAAHRLWRLYRQEAQWLRKAKQTVLLPTNWIR